MLLTLKSIQWERLQSLGFREIIGTKQAKDNGHDTWNLACEDLVRVRDHVRCCKRISEI
jgi:hypothetical protein